MVSSPSSSRLLSVVRVAGHRSNVIRTLITSQRNDQSEVDARSALALCLKNTNVQICGPLYQKYKELGWKRYRDVPAEGIATKASYFDNISLVGQSRGTVVMVPGSPGYFTHFTSLIEFLTKRGVRVIAPNFPTLSLTKVNKYYRHSPEERVEFLKAILNETGVTSIDLLASHSSGTFVSTSFWRDTNVPAPVKSLAMFNPIGCEHVVPMQPYWVMSGFTKAWQTKAGRAALERLGVPLMNRMGNPFAKNSLEDIVWGTFCLHYNDQAKLKRTIEEITEQKVPLLMVIADNDSVMNSKMNVNLVKTFGSSIDDAHLYDKSGHLERVAAYSERLKLIRTRSGGHFSFIKYPSIVNQAVADLLDKVIEQNNVTLEAEVKGQMVGRDMYLVG